MNRWMLAGLLFASPLAWAALGEAPAPLAAAARHATQPLQTGAGVPYTEVSRTLPSQVVVREFVDASGTVFAVSWSGPFRPDMKELLGRHFEPVREHAAGGAGERSRLQVETGEAVVVSGGHMGAFQGRAWLPARLPAGFDTEQMK